MQLIEDEDPGRAEQCLLVAEEKASRLAAMDMDGDSMAVVVCLHVCAQGDRQLCVDVQP